MHVIRELDDLGFSDSSGIADSGKWPEVKARRSGRIRARAYREFKAANKIFWLMFNLIVFLVSAGWLIGSYFYLAEDVSGDDCHMYMVMYVGCVVHLLNMLISMLNFCGCEEKICNQNMVCAFVCVEIAGIVWVQIGYFDAQLKDTICTDYFFVMG